MINTISDLEISTQQKVSKAYSAMSDSKKLKDLGVEQVKIIETRRALSVQMAYYSRSRMSSPDVKAMYRATGLYSISTEETKIPNTWTLESKHITGKAADIAPVKNGKIWWNAPEDVWEEMGRIGESFGLKWGGRWKEKDCPHFEN